jgi:hypothetical protein
MPLNAAPSRTMAAPPEPPLYNLLCCAGPRPSRPYQLGILTQFDGRVVVVPGFSSVARANAPQNRSATEGTRCNWLPRFIDWDHRA